MGQYRFFEYLADDSTFDINTSKLGINDPGLYRGFDFSPTANMNLTLSHTVTGAQKTLLDKNLSNRFGVIVTNQGTIINEDAPVVVPINPTAGSHRTDLIVCEHDFILTQGGKTAIYTVIEGAPGGAVPARSKPNIQIIVGVLKLPPNCTSLSNPNIVYERPLTPAFAGSEDFLRRKNGSLLSDLNANGFKITNLKAATTDLDAVNLKQVNDIINALFPIGAVMEWEGAIDQIPVKWALMNGQNGTPDLTDCFTVGAGSSYQIGDRGGENLLKLKLENMPSHGHVMENAGSHSHSGTANAAGIHSHTGSISSSGTAHDHYYRDSFYSENANMGSGPGYSTEYHSTPYPGSDSGYDIDNRYLAGRDKKTAIGGVHSHSFTINNSGSHGHVLTIGHSGTHAHVIQNTGGDKAFNNMPKYYALAKIKKIAN